MADLVLGTPKDIFKALMAIKDYVETFRQNDEERRKLQDLSQILIPILSRQVRGLRSDPELSPAQVPLQMSVDRALQIVNKWQERNRMHRFVRTRGMDKELRRGKDDIHFNMNLENSAIICSMHERIKRMELTVEWIKETITTVAYGGVHPPLTQLQNNAAAMENYSTAGHAGSVEYTMVTTRPEEAPSAPSSSVTEFSVSETVATHHVFEENINGESIYTTVSKQKIVIKVQISCDKCRSMAMALVAKACGVDSVKIAGESKDQLVVLGSDVNAIMLTTALRRKVGPAQLLELEEIRPHDNDMRPRLVNATDEAVTRWPRARSSRGIRAITAKLFRFMRPRPGRNPCQAAAPSSSPLLLERPDTPGPATGPPPLLLPGNSAASSSMSTPTPQARIQQCQETVGNSARLAEDGDLFERPGPQLLQHQPAAPPAKVRVQRRRRTFNMSRVHRVVRYYG